MREGGWASGSYRLLLNSRERIRGLYMQLGDTMKRITLILAILCVSVAYGQDGRKGFHTGTGSPLLQVPIPYCDAGDIWTDTLTGTLYTASGYPCTWAATGGGSLPPGVTANGANGITITGTPVNPTDAATVGYVAAHPGPTGPAGSTGATGPAGATLPASPAMVYGLTTTTSREIGRASCRERV